MAPDDTRDTIRTFLLGSLSIPVLGDEDDIFDLGFANSLFAMQLVEFVEREFSIVIDDADLEIEYFRSVASIAALVARKRERSDGPPRAAAGVHGLNA